MHAKDLLWTIDFGINSSNRFHFRASKQDRQWTQVADAADQLTHATATASTDN